MEYTVLIVLLPMLTFFVLGLLGKRLGPCASGLSPCAVYSSAFL